MSIPGLINRGIGFNAGIQYEVTLGLLPGAVVFRDTLCADLVITPTLSGSLAIDTTLNGIVDVVSTLDGQVEVDSC